MVKATLLAVLAWLGRKVGRALHGAERGVVVAVRWINRFLFTDTDPVEQLVWHRKPLSVIVIYAFLACLAYWGIHVPPPGYAVTVLAVAAAVMSMRGEMHGKEKLAWIVLLFAFLFLELTAIRIDRKANEELQAQARWQEAREFKTIGTGITSGIQKVLDQGSGQFQMTLDQQKRQYNEQTGGDSFTIVVPKGDITPLDLGLKTCDKCKYGIPKAYVSVEHVPNSGPPEPSWNLFEGPIDAGFFNWVHTNISPAPDGESKYTINVLATNGITIEDLRIRRKAKIKSWEFSYTVNRVLHTGRLNRATNTIEIVEKQVANQPWNSLTNAGDVPVKVKMLH